MKINKKYFSSFVLVVSVFIFSITFVLIAPFSKVLAQQEAVVASDSSDLTLPTPTPPATISATPLDLSNLNNLDLPINNQKAAVKSLNSLEDETIIQITGTSGTPYKFVKSTPDSDADKLAAGHTYWILVDNYCDLHPLVAPCAASDSKNQDQPLADQILDALYHDLPLVVAGLAKNNAIVATSNYERSKGNFLVDLFTGKDQVPSIWLAAGITTHCGSGTSEDPYRLVGDSCGTNLTSLINQQSFLFGNFSENDQNLQAQLLQQRLAALSDPHLSLSVAHPQDNRLTTVEAGISFAGTYNVFNDTDNPLTLTITATIDQAVKTYTQEIPPQTLYTDQAWNLTWSVDEIAEGTHFGPSSPLTFAANFGDLYQASAIYYGYLVAGDESILPSSLYLISQVPQLLNVRFAGMLHLPVGTSAGTTGYPDTSEYTFSSALDANHAIWHKEINSVVYPFLVEFFSPPDDGGSVSGFTPQATSSSTTP